MTPREKDIDAAVRRAFREDRTLAWVDDGDIVFSPRLLDAAKRCWRDIQKDRARLHRYGILSRRSQDIIMDAWARGAAQ